MNTEDWLDAPALESVDNTTALALLNESQAHAVRAVKAIETELAQAAADMAARLADSGRIIFVGAGASIRIAVQDGVELKPTYGWPDDRLAYLVAGGETALIRSVEGAEDDTADADAQIDALDLTPNDVVIGLAASGRTPFTVRCLEAAREAGALTIGLANNTPSPVLDAAEHALHLATGAEVIAGSTRMAAGTAQKVCLNQLTTLVMVRLNRTYRNLMVDMDARNAKLNQRRVHMLQRIFPGLSQPKAQTALDACEGHVKWAAATLKVGSVEAAREALNLEKNNLRKIMGD